jgi:hypothetical protein
MCTRKLIEVNLSHPVVDGMAREESTLRGDTRGNGTARTPYVLPHSLYGVRCEGRWGGQIDVYATELTPLCDVQGQPSDKHVRLPRSVDL